MPDYPKGKQVAAMQSFTLGSAEMMEALEAAIRAKGESFEMKLNVDDLVALVAVLGAQVGYYDTREDDEERTVSLFSSIAEQYRIEGV